MIMAQSAGSFWMPPQASTSAQEVDWVFYFVYWIAVFFFLLIVGIMTVFVIKYRRREGWEEEQTTESHTALEITWTVIPILIVLVIFFFGFRTYMDLHLAPGNTLDIWVTGQKWQWFFKYPNGHIDENLHIPVDTPVKLIISSEDVTHSLFIPAFRLKMDAVPGRLTSAWAKATQTGTFPIYCAEYCGTGHSDMFAELTVHEPGGYETWLEEASNLLKSMTPVEAGAVLYKRKGCAQCHTIDGSADDGPTFLGIFGHTVKLSDGSTVTVDEDYIRRSLLEPAAQIVAGFENIMPTFQGKLKDEEIAAIIEYIKTLKEKTGSGS